MRRKMLIVLIALVALLVPGFAWANPVTAFGQVYATYPPGTYSQATSHNQYEETTEVYRTNPVGNRFRFTCRVRGAAIYDAQLTVVGRVLARVCVVENVSITPHTFAVADVVQTWDAGLGYPSLQNVYVTATLSHSSSSDYYQKTVTDGPIPANQQIVVLPKDGTYDDYSEVATTHPAWATCTVFHNDANCDGGVEAHMNLTISGTLCHGLSCTSFTPFAMGSGGMDTGIIYIRQTD